MKRLMLLLSLSLFFIESFSQIKENVLCVYSKTDEPICFLLSDNPKIRILGEYIFFSSSKKQIQYPLADFLKFTFENKVETGIGVPPKNNDVIYNILGEHILIKNGLANSKVYVYSSDGVLKMTSLIDSEGNCSLPLPNKGIYIIKNNKHTFKILVK